jgi:hypothetical protein
MFLRESRFLHEVYGVTSKKIRLEFVSDRMSYIIRRGRWFHTIVLNVHAPTN